MSGQNWVKRGVLPGTGVAIAITCGFKPSRVSLFNSDGLVSAEKTDTMDAAKAMKRITAGDATYVDAVTLNDNGFVIGADADLNAAGEEIHYVAHQAQND